jgi:urea carboxylase-associated protein 2
METSTTAGARAHARAQAGVRAASMRWVPAASAPDIAPDVEGDRVVWDETLAPGRYTSKVLARGTIVRFVDVEGLACLQLLAFNALLPSERLNVADTVKVQWQAYLGEGTLLLTDLGRVLATIVKDTSGHHDALCGVRSGGSVADATPSARQLLTLGAARHGLERRDVHPALNLFKGVRVAGDGGLMFEGGSGARATVELRLELPAILVLSNTPHVLDDAGTATPVRITAWSAAAATAADDPWRDTSPEASRAFDNTDEFLAGHPFGGA